MNDRRKTSIYLGPTEDRRIEDIKHALGTDSDAAAIRYAILHVRVPAPK